MKTKRLTESAMLLALAIVLELISKAIIPEMPFGGQVTLVAMLPVVLISYRYGVKWGFVSGFCYALLEMAGRKRGFLLRGGEVHTERMAKVLMDEFRGGKLGKFTLEMPEDLECRS